MIPTGAPTNSVSTVCAICASTTSSKSSASSERSARNRLTSSAALEETPAPSGMVDSILTSKPGTSIPRRPSAKVTPWT
jgi:hypothetical protein